MATYAIIPSAGSGKRFDSDIPKTLVELAGSPIIVHTLKAFDVCGDIDGLIAVVPAERIEEFETLVKSIGLTKPCHVVAGGKERSDSVYNGLLAAEGADIVLVHDGARPLVSGDVIARCVDAVREYGAAVVAVPVTSTMKCVDAQTQLVKQTLNRSELWEAQTPQGFRSDVLRKALESGDRSSATDDAMLVEQMGQPIKIVLGEYSNIKITTQSDIQTAEAYLAKGQHD